MPTMTQAANEYLTTMEASGASASAVRNTRITLTQLCAATGPSILSSSLAHHHIDKWRTGHTWSATTYNLKMSHVRGFVTWMQKRRYMPSTSDVLYGYKAQKVPQKDRLRIPQTEWGRVLDCAVHPADRILVACGFYLMARPSEIASMRVRDVDITEQQVHLTRHKSRRVDVMPICNELLGEMGRWFSWYTANADVRPESFYVPSKRVGVIAWDPILRQLAEPEGGRAVVPTRFLIQPSVQVKRVLRRAGYATYREGGHTLRRSGARAYYDELAATGHDGALRKVQTMLDHANSVVTEVYLGTTRDKADRDKDLRGKPMFRSGDGGAGDSHV